MTDATPSPDIRGVRADDLPAIYGILFAAHDAGELAGTERRDLEHLLALIAVDAEGMLVGLAGDEVVGFFAPDYPMLVVHHLYRRQRLGTRLVERALADIAKHGRAEVELAPPLGNGPAEAFAASLGFAYRSSLWQMRLGPSVDVPSPDIPDGFDVRAFQPSADDERYVDLLTASFADHPSPLVVSVEIVRLAHTRTSFDPAHIAIVTAQDDPARLVAFGRTTLDTDADRHAEIAHVGVLPEFRGLGIGCELLRWGVQHLRSRGAGDIFLAVEGRNDRALRIYEQTGFVRVQEWPRWVVSASGGSSRRAELARVIRTNCPDNESCPHSRAGTV